MKTIFLRIRLSLFLIFFTCIIFSSASSQKVECWENSKYPNVFQVNTNDIKCIAKQSEKNTVFVTFAPWCLSCLYNIKTAFELEIKYDVNVYVYVIMVDSQNDPYTKQGIAFLRKRNPYTKILFLKDADYGKRTKKRYKKFLDEVTPPQFENINCMGKYIVLDKDGNTFLVTNYKDSVNDDWKDDSDMVKRLVEALLKKKDD